MIPYKPIETISLGPITIRTWGLMVALGFLAALLVGVYEAKRKKINVDHIYSICLYAIIFGLLGGRLFYVAAHLDHYRQNPLSVLKIWEGGMVFYGGFLAASLAICLYIRKHKLDIWKIADIVALSLGVGIFFGRIGCYLIGDHMGKITDFFLGVTYFGEIRHNTALYSSLAGLVIFLILWFLKNRIRISGVLFIIFIFWYSVTRFFIDQFRDFDIRLYGLTGSQFLSIIVFFVAIYLLRYRLESKKI
jgi:phosphatidylglycerol:prolipoprotein diacylglycerol transferase